MSIETDLAQEITDSFFSDTKKVSVEEIEEAIRSTQEDMVDDVVQEVKTILSDQGVKVTGGKK